MATAAIANNPQSMVGHYSGGTHREYTEEAWIALCRSNAIKYFNMTEFGWSQYLDDHREAVMSCYRAGTRPWNTLRQLIHNL